MTVYLPPTLTSVSIVKGQNLSVMVQMGSCLWHTIYPPIPVSATSELNPFIQRSVARWQRYS